MVLSEQYSAADVQSQVGSLTRTTDGESSVFDHLLVAERSDRLVGVTWGTTAPGRSAGVWPPVLTHAEAEETSRLLMAKLEARLLSAGTQLMQAMLPTDRGHAPQRLITAGFDHAARVNFLIRTMGSPRTPEPTSELEFVPIADEECAELAEVIQSTYEDSRDFPTLDGRRDASDIMHAYRSAAADTVHRWYLVQRLGERIGCLLLFDYPAEEQVELAYMGLIASVRGRGWGRQLVSRAVQITEQLGREQIVVAVDSRNGPALNIYESLDFIRGGTCDAYIKFLHPA